MRFLNTKRRLYALLALILLFLLVSVVRWFLGSSASSLGLTSHFPGMGEVIERSTPLSFTLTGDGELELEKVAAFINGDLQESITKALDDNRLVIEPSQNNAWPSCDFSLSLDISGKREYKNSKQFSYFVSPCARILASSTAIEVPSKIKLTPDIITDSVIQKYEWDLDGDGEYEKVDAIGRDQMLMLKSQQELTVSLRVTDLENEKHVGKVDIKGLNGKPVIKSIRITPRHSPVFTNVNFHVAATDHERIDRYEWDFNGDGVVDETTARGVLTHIYESVGHFQASVTVFDKLGESVIVKTPATRVNITEKKAARLEFSQSNRLGNKTVPKEAIFSVKLYSPQRRLVVPAKIEIDFDGDGIIDDVLDEIKTNASAITHTYDRAGQFFPHVRVTDEKGEVFESSESVELQANVLLTVNKHNVDVDLGEIAIIETQLGGPLAINLFIEDKNGQLVRTLLDDVERDAGVYEDTWDGSNDRGEPVPDGAYYAVLVYSIGADRKRVDARANSAIRDLPVPRTDIPKTFSPFSGKPLKVTFNLEKAKEISAFVGFLSTSQRIHTLFQRRAFAAGQHTLSWVGENSHGVIKHPPERDGFLFGIWGFDIAENAIVVRSTTHVTAMQVLPFIFNPAAIESDDVVYSKISFELSHQSNVEMTIYDADSGELVLRRIEQDMSIGDNVMTWDGKTDQGEFVAPGRYRIGIVAINSYGERSLASYALQRIYY